MDYRTRKNTNKGGMNMAREHPYFREILANYRNIFSKDRFRKSDICEKLGYSPKQATAIFSLDKGGYIDIHLMAATMYRNMKKEDL